MAARGLTIKLTIPGLTRLDQALALTRLMIGSTNADDYNGCERRTLYCYDAFPIDDGGDVPTYTVCVVLTFHPTAYKRTDPLYRLHYGDLGLRLVAIDLTSQGEL
jgi:hypothetical protein